LLLSISFIGFALQSHAQKTEQYVLGPGDKIQIQVFGEDELSITTVLGGSGIINYPFLGELKITGLSIKEVEVLIAKGLKDGYLKKPNVFTAIAEYRPFYIQGEVNAPGGYPYQPGLTINQAVALAGGLTERASEDEIYIFREHDKSIKLKSSLSYKISAGDTITIEQSFF